MRRNSRKFYGLIGDGCPLGSSVQGHDTLTDIGANVAQVFTAGNAFDTTWKQCYENCNWDEMEVGNAQCKSIGGKFIHQRKPVSRV